MSRESLWRRVSVGALVLMAAGAAHAQLTTGNLYGRVTDVYGATYVGRLRWGGNEEAFWGNYFNGFKEENRWADHLVARLHDCLDEFVQAVDVDDDESIVFGLTHGKSP